MLTIDFINFSPNSDPGWPSLILTTGTSIIRMACKKKKNEAFDIKLATCGWQIQPDSHMNQKERTSNKCQPKSGKKSSVNSKWRVVDSLSCCFLPLIKLCGCAPTAEWKQEKSISKSLAIWQPSHAFSQGQKEEDFWTGAGTWHQFKNTYLYQLFFSTWLHRHLDVSKEKHLNLTPGRALRAKVKWWKQTADEKFKTCPPNFLMVPLPKSKTYCWTPKLRSKAIVCFETTRCVRTQSCCLYWATKTVMLNYFMKTITRAV